MKSFKRGDKVAVYGKPGVVRWITKSSGRVVWVGVSLDGEGDRVDEWQPTEIESAK